MTPATEDAIAAIVGAAVADLPLPIPGAEQVGEAVAHMLLRYLSGESAASVISTPAARATGVDLEAIRASLVASE